MPDQMEFLDWETMFTIDSHLTKQPQKSFGLGINYLEASKPFVCIRIQEQTLSFQQNLNVGVGGVIWDCAKSLVEFFSLSPQHVYGRNIVELGCGTGVVGLICGCLGAQSVILSDLPDLVNLAKINIEGIAKQNRSLSALHQAGKLTATPYIWGEKLHSFGSVDVLICSDCIYEHSNFQSFLNSLQLLIENNTIAFLAYKSRFPKKEYYHFKEIGQCFNISVYSRDGKSPFNFLPDVYICKIKRCS